MKKYKVELEIKVKENWADVEDFGKTIELFNSANEGVLEAEIKKVKEIKKILK